MKVKFKFFAGWEMCNLFFPSVLPLPSFTLPNPYGARVCFYASVLPSSEPFLLGPLLNSEAP